MVATGGLSIPSAGASPLGYRIAESFGLALIPTTAGLVPFTLQKVDKERLAPLAGIAIPAEVSAGGKSFQENLLFTHRGISGPAVLQASNYWTPGDTVTIDLLPGVTVDELLSGTDETQRKTLVKNLLNRLLPKRLVAAVLPGDLADRTVSSLTAKDLHRAADALHRWQIRPAGTEGARTAEVTCGGVDTRELSSKTFECRTIPGLRFIGEVLDVTGQLGGYNLQWAWSSGWCAGQSA